MALLELDVNHRLRSYDLDLALSVDRETVAIVGPSGAGKSTVLRIVAGLLAPDRGRVALDGEPWFDPARRVNLPPERRRVGLVFQDYALFPHMTVRENVAFGGSARADELLERLRVSHLANDKPGRLSGGERQRVAVARALSRDPGVLLLDEPLSALDAATRTIVRGELADVLRELELPTVLVTHDFGDAAQLADRAGVIVDGRLRQLTTPSLLVEEPADAFVAQFTGANVLHGQAAGSVVTLDDGGILPTLTPHQGPVSVAVAPWHVRLQPERSDDGHGLAVRISAVTPEHGRIRVRTDRLIADVDMADGLQRGDVAWALTDPQHVRVLLPTHAVA